MYQLVRQVAGLKMWLTEEQYKNLPACDKENYVDMTKYVIEDAEPIAPAHQ